MNVNCVIVIHAAGFRYSLLDGCFRRRAVHQKRVTRDESRSNDPRQLLRIDVTGHGWKMNIGTGRVTPFMSLLKIVSGGQTGVDRGALDAALDAGFPCGGWATEDRVAEDGTIPAHYPLAELPGGGYEERTLQNVLDSDGTVILHFGVLEGGTRQTRDCCKAHGKPHEIIDASLVAPEEAAPRLAAFIERHRIAVLNVAGPRASKWPGAHDYAYATMKHLLQAIAKEHR